ncbi:hypothetical protein ACHAWF_012087 [Thalassiosira exigua]
MTSRRTTRIASAAAALAALFALPVRPEEDDPSRGPAAVEKDRVCSVDPDGRQVCEAVYVDSDDYDVRTPPPPSSDDYDEEEDSDDDGYDYAERGCADRHPACPDLAARGECAYNPGFAKYRCALSCGTCPEYAAAHEALQGDGRRGDGPCTDLHPKCKMWATGGECGFNPTFMLEECERSCVVCFEDTNQFGVHQTLPPEDNEHYEATKDIIDESIKYMRSMWSPSAETNRVNYKCRNTDADCSYWAIEECEGEGDNAEWMRENCAPACQTCHLLDFQLRCPIEEGNEPVYKPGDLNALFEKIVDDASGSGEYLKYRPRALSRPRLRADGTAVPGVEEDGPWVAVLDGFITDAEAEALIAAGHERGFERSTDVGVENPDGSHEDDVSEGRTSHNAWCDAELCNEDPIIGPAIERIAWLTGTSAHNSEDLQLLRYEPGQFYNQHHDYIEFQQELPCGPRMLTLFLYLNDVEEGGGTRFPLLDLTVQPKKGSALLWPSVLDDEVEEKDFRTDHEALPVIKGVKYGANAWIHTRNFQEALQNDCS